VRVKEVVMLESGAAKTRYEWPENEGTVIAVSMFVWDGGWRQRGEYCKFQACIDTCTHQ